MQTDMIIRRISNMHIAQTRLSLRASTMVRVEGVLREFASWLAQHAPEVGCVAETC